MERELVWKQVYRAVRTISHDFPENHPGQGHPDVYPTWVIAVCWLWSCLWREPLAWSMRTLASRKKRRRYGQLGFPLPENIPDPSTVCRRMKRLDFQATLEAANRRLIGQLLAADSCHTLISDSSALDIPLFSHDADARFGHHGHFGYRLHTVATHDRIILVHQTVPSNEQELAVFPTLVERAETLGIQCRYLAADIGYDSENAHRAAQARLGGMLLAPLNTRGGKPAFTRTPLRKAMWRVWRTPEVRQARRKRPQIERIYSVLKGPFAMDSLPRHIRGLPRTRRFLNGVMILYHGYLLEKRNKYAA
jgi:hypothetical protein